MNELAPRYYPSGSPVSPVSRFGGQPVFIGIAALAVMQLSQYQPRNEKSCQSNPDQNNHQRPDAADWSIDNAR